MFCLTPNRNTRKKTEKNQKLFLWLMFTVPVRWYIKRIFIFKEFFYNSNINKRDKNAFRTQSRWLQLVVGLVKVFPVCSRWQRSNIASRLNMTMKSGWKVSIKQRSWPSFWTCSMFCFSRYRWQVRWQLNKSKETNFEVRLLDEKYRQAIVSRKSCTKSLIKNRSRLVIGLFCLGYHVAPSTRYGVSETRNLALLNDSPESSGGRKCRNLRVGFIRTN